MILNGNKNTTFNSYLKIFKTYKKLKKILPFGYIQTKISPSQKYSFKNNRIINLEKEKKATKINKNLLSNKNIYIFSEDNENTKKIIYNLKKFYLNKNPNRNIYPMKSESNIISRNKYNFDKFTNLSNYRNEINKKNNNKKYFNTGFNEKEKNHNLRKNNNIINSNSYTNFKFFRSSSINNCFMKNNIYLPSMTNRLKNSMPRYQRQNNGFILNGFGKESLKELKINIFNNCNKNKIDEINEKNMMLRKIIFIKNKNNSSYTKSYDIKNDTIINNIIKSKKNYKNQLYKKNIKIDDNIE